MVSRFGRLWFIAALTTILVALALPAAAFQAPGSSPTTDGLAGSAAPGIPEFALRITGKKVTIRTADGTEHRGIFAVAETGLVSRDGNAGVSVPFDQVVRVRKVTHRAPYGALIGFAAGVALGTLVPAPANCSPTNCQGSSFVALYGGIGAGIGAALGGAVTAASRDIDVLYDARRGAKSITIAPILAPSQKAVVLNIAWR